ncbi:MAG: SDR family oxidoreductase [Rhodocyclaceae bacterium]|jgi:NAD(P)-dependent dehydrogenase (short-subunit alcohol dehydrogenase family)|nr:SDR family oxidoreductase [Rhodocyclaceae bacterium]MCE2981361.1 SDR family oxidoreductase [Betaproteobacteria bacterium]MCA3077106.1 SDR family oxidoreductase [Rhodocyclaceae bacterium]MCA3089891.1 SDR family oxidoreductase [Rhodocyclaceae bacterium]MCA3093539.1 SDR family oxidoreductase [Rhodocyclaceae bacterium]
MSVPSLEGRFAIVTGASSPGGIGRAIARRFAREGASVLLVADGTPAQLDDARALCAAEGGSGRIEVLPIDLSLPEGPASMIGAAVHLFGRVDILVNNAATRAPMPFGDYTREQFDRVVAVNLAAPFFASQAVLPLMRRQGGGRIIHIASQLGHVAGAGRALYGLTKAALIHLTKSMAFELGRENILVNAISPGPVATPAVVGSRSDAELAARFAQYLPAGRLGRPEEIAELALFLAASSPAFLQGQDVLVDGGYTLH